MPQRLGVDVGGTAGERRECGVGAHEAVGRFIQRAVTCQHRDHVDAIGCGAPSEAGRMPAA